MGVDGKWGGLFTFGVRLEEYSDLSKQPPEQGNHLLNAAKMLRFQPKPVKILLNSNYQTYTNIFAW